MLLTPNYNLKKPEGTDVVNIDDLNGNADIIDTKLKELNDSKATKNLATISVNGLMSSTDKKKLDGVAAGANNYTHPVTHPATIITQDANNRFVTDTEKSTWNGKASTAVATTSANGLMSKTDKEKLDGVANGANAYVHPNNHSATMITEDATHRFVTDTEKKSWNEKASKNTALKALSGWHKDTDAGIITQWLLVNVTISPKGLDERPVTLPISFTGDIVSISAICAYNTTYKNANYLEYINFGARVRALNSIDLYSRDVVGIPTTLNFEVRIEVKGW